MTVVITGGVTRTGQIDGISAAGADPELLVHTPSADLEIVAAGRLEAAPVMPVSPTGCPTPAVITRAVRELVGFDLVCVDGGLARPTGVSTADVGATPGADIREPEAVPDASAIASAASDLVAEFPDGELVLAETIPGGTTTALGVLTALGERATVSSSLPENPLSRKRTVVSEGLGASGLEPGDATGEPLEALQSMGDPVLATVYGLIDGAAERNLDVILAGGTQLLAAGALARHGGIDCDLTLATTVFVAEDSTAAVEELASDLSINLTVTDPGFGARDHPALSRFVAGEAKEGVGMGGALALADRQDVSMGEVRDQIVSRYDRLVSTEQI